MTSPGSGDTPDLEGAWRALTDTHELREQILESLPVGLWVLDGRGRILKGNAASQRIWAGLRHVGIDEYDVYKAWRLKGGDPIRPREWAGARAVEKGETSPGEELEIECFDGARKIILASAVPLRDPAGAVVGAVVLHQDITDRKRAELRLQELANTDFVTGACNRRRFYELLNLELPRARRYSRDFSVVLLDVDRFRSVNDAHGNAAGDDVLRSLAADVRTRVRRTDVLCRHGGDEFVLGLTETGLEGALVVAENLRAVVGELRLSSGLKITCSFGVAALAPGDTSPTLIKRADEALYRAKAHGGDRVEAG